MIDLAKEIWQTMRTNKLRTILTGISVSWGIFMLILLLAVSNGVVNNTREMMNSNDPYRITVWPGRTTMPYQGMKEGRAIDLKQKGMSAILEDNPGNVNAVDGTISVDARISTSRDYVTSQCEGVFPANFTARYTLLQGRFLNDADLRNSRKSIVLHRRALPTLFADTTNVVGQIVKVGNIAFTVVGVYDMGWEETAYIPFTTANAITGYKDKLSRIDVHIAGVADAKQSGALEEDVRHSLAKVNHFDPADDSAVFTYDRFASYIQSLTATNILNIAMWVIGLLTLITGIVGVSNIMFVSVRERTHEIGIRRAIGAKPRNLLVQVVLESVALTTCFGYIGIVMGTLATELVKKQFAGENFMLDPTVDINIAIEVTVALIIAGALAGFFPAMRAIKVKPVEALHDE